MLSVLLFAFVKSCICLQKKKWSLRFLSLNDCLAVSSATLEESCVSTALLSRNMRWTHDNSFQANLQLF